LVFFSSFFGETAHDKDATKEKNGKKEKQRSRKMQISAYNIKEDESSFF